MTRLACILVESQSRWLSNGRAAGLCAVYCLVCPVVPKWPKNHFWGSFGGDFWVDFGPFPDAFPIIFRQFPLHNRPLFDRFGPSLTLICTVFVLFLGSFWGHFWVVFGSILAPPGPKFSRNMKSTVRPNMSQNSQKHTSTRSRGQVGPSRKIFFFVMETESNRPGRLLSRFRGVSRFFKYSRFMG